jgi:hypothetical protein
MEIFSALPDELTGGSDTSNTTGIIGELCLGSPVNAARVRVSYKEKPHDHLLPVLHPTVKI